MTVTDPDTAGQVGELAAPFPYFGGKRRAAALIWDYLGDPGNYMEPFAGSCAVLLRRPRFEGRRIETVNDADGWLVNTWRALRAAPDLVAEHAAGPPTEIDYHARLAWLQGRRGDDLVSWLEGDPEVFDAKAAGWWLYVTALGIGDPYCAGPWRVVDGRLVKGDPGGGVIRNLPHLGCAGRGVNRELPAGGMGASREIPYLGSSGQGVHRTLEPGGQGIMGGKLLTSCENGITTQEIGGTGYEDGPDFDGDPAAEQRGSLVRYFRLIAQRLARVRIICGDWDRCVTPAVRGPATGGDRSKAVLLDPPYATSGDLYHHGDSDGTLSSQVRAWCVDMTTAEPDMKMILCGYDTEHDQLLDHGWRVEQSKGGSGSGYSKNPENGRRERLWISPACARAEASLF